MLKGTVTLQAAMRENGLMFPLVEFYPKEPGVAKVEIEGLSNSNEIRTTVYFAAVASVAEAEELAMKVTAAALDRIAFHYAVVIEPARMTGRSLSRDDLPPGVLDVEAGELVLVGHRARLVVGLPADTVRTALEEPAPPGELYYGLFRSARSATSPVEEFMLLYSLLLMRHNDRQLDVDAFIQNEDPAVPLTPSPHTPGRTETVYTRLRNEVGHSRPGVLPDRTRTEMADRLNGLRALTKRAIELHS